MDLPSGSLACAADIARFHPEAQAAGRLGHPGIIQVHQVGQVDGKHFYTMEFVDGIDLSQLLRRGPLAPERVAEILKAVAEAIQHAHEHSIIHRDLKPANVILDCRGRPVVGDFGLAKQMDQDAGLTSTGASLGTPAYMSPEQAAGNLPQCGPATDVYSLGAILYEMLTGRPPFREASAVESLLATIHKEPLPPRAIQPAVDRNLEAICLKCLSKDPRQRYATARELDDDLGRFLSGIPVLARPTSSAARCWRWCRDIPVVAALIGRRVINPSVTQRTVHWVVVSGVLLLVATITVAWLGMPNAEMAYPERLRFAAGHRGGGYHDLAGAFGGLFQQSSGLVPEIQETSGAVENGTLLLERRSDAALLQSAAITSDKLAVVAPLYDEYLYFLVRPELDLGSVRQLEGRTVVVGNDGSGMQLSSSRVLSRLAIGAVQIKADFAELPQHGEWDAAIVTTGPRNAKLRAILDGGQFQLLPLSADDQKRLTGPVFLPGAIKAGSLGIYGGEAASVPPHDIPTVTTTTFLVVHKNASSKLVTQLLSVLYSSSKLAREFELLPREEAAQWPALPLHSADAAFFGSD